MPDLYRTVRVLPEGREAVDAITAMISGRTEKRLTITQALVEAKRIIRETIEADRQTSRI